ncbi:MAG: nucleotidyltransferase domain-containing protein [Candidatus Omnitrophica bacterium]|nr:nucleotidyltransferase domain-containing protein [Candidatus Omnitrophota bacterium]
MAGFLEKAHKRKIERQKKLRTAALKEAQRIGRLLVSRFGAQRVILFGSLASGECSSFGEHSDIDLAVQGLGENFYRAYGYCLRHCNFSLDIKPYEILPEKFKSEVDKKGFCIYEQIK